MNLSNLSQNAIRGLREIHGPVRYLYPGPDHVRTGPVEESLLLMSPCTSENAFRDPGFHHLYRALQRHSDVPVEHIVRPDDDFIEMAADRDLAPWSLQSRRSIYSFPAWLVYLSGPEDWFLFRDLLSTLTSHPAEEGLPSSIILYAQNLPSFLSPPELDPVKGLIVEQKHGNTGEQLVSQVHEHLPDPVRSSPSSFGNRSAERSSPPSVDHPLRPIPSINNRIEDTLWIGDPRPVERNRSITSPTVLPAELDSPRQTIDNVEHLFDAHGARTVSIESDASRDNGNGPTEAWTLEFAQRFCSRFPDRPVSYRLANPRPDHAIWTYEHLLEHYSNESLRAHLHRARSARGIDMSSSVSRWLNYFLSGGGPKMTFYATVRNGHGGSGDARNLIEKIVTLNKQAIDGKGQLFVRLQPALDRPTGWQPSDVHEKWVQSLSSTFSSAPVTIELDLPDQYSSIRDRFLQSAPSGHRNDP